MVAWCFCSSDEEVAEEGHNLHLDWILNVLVTFWLLSRCASIPLQEKFISLSVEQFSYIYCGEKIRQDAGHSSKLLPQNLHKQWLLLSKQFSCPAFSQLRFGLVVQKLEPTLSLCF